NSGILQSHPIMEGVGGGYEIESCGHLDRLSFGPVVYDSPPACESKSFGTFGDRYVLLGFDFIKNFNYIFDFPHSMIVMIPHKQ
ncbi:MAG TPA: hypothetical protein VK669_12715, partial [Candidatus Limnocylindrales bacterium]|nr:hypothetical protein [Candidatus Limnocylindrales bacterium]